MKKVIIFAALAAIALAACQQGLQRPSQWVLRPPRLCRIALAYQSKKISRHFPFGEVAGLLFLIVRSVNETFKES